MTGRRGKTHPSHGVDGRLPELVVEIVSLDKADAVLARDGAFHLDGPFHHAVYDVCGDLTLGLVEEENC